MSEIEKARVLLSEELKECQKLDSVTIKTFGDWNWEVHLQFDKKTTLGKDLFVHSLKFNTKNESIILNFNFNSNFNQQPPVVRMVKPRLISLTGNVSTSGTFVSLDIITEKGWKKSDKTVASIIKEIKNELVNNYATIDMRVSKGYNTMKTLQQEDRMIQREFERNKISTTNNFNQSYRVVASKNDTETGDNIILPKSASSIINQSEKPYIFEIKGSTTRIYGGSGYRNMEFTAPKGCVILPKWMMRSLFIKEGESVDVRSVKLSKGKYCKVQPQSKEFYKIENHQKSLESMLTNFRTLTEGQFLPLVEGDKTHWVEVLDLKPSKAVIIDPGRDKYIDLVIDFAPAIDFDDSEEFTNDPVDDKIQDVQLPPEPESPFSGRRLGNSSTVFDDKDGIFCSNCELIIPKDKYKMHEIHCSRNVYKCKECNVTMLTHERKDHDYLYHRKIKCECGEEVSKSSLKLHKLSKCAERIRFCSYCKLILNESQREKHEKICDKKPKEEEKIKEENSLIGRRDDESNSLIRKRDENDDKPIIEKPNENKIENLKCETCGRTFPSDRMAMHKVRCK
eukprot:gene1982-1490_t